MQTYQKEQSVPEHTRILREPRYQKGNEQRGTNEKIVRSHGRNTPKLTKVQRETKVTAKRLHKRK